MIYTNYPCFKSFILYMVRHYLQNINIIYVKLCRYEAQARRQGRGHREHCPPVPKNINLVLRAKETFFNLKLSKKDADLMLR